MPKVYEQSIHTTAAEGTDRFDSAVLRLVKNIEAQARKEGYELGTMSKTITGGKVSIKVTGVKKEKSEVRKNEGTSRKKKPASKPTEREK